MAWSKKEFLIDRLTNSMEFYDKLGFVDHMAEECGFDRKEMAVVFDEFWELPAMDRCNWWPADWEKWLSKYVNSKNLV